MTRKERKEEADKRRIALAREIYKKMKEYDARASELELTNNVREKYIQERLDWLIKELTGPKHECHMIQSALYIITKALEKQDYALLQ